MSAIITSAAIGIGGAVAKTVLKLWIGNPALDDISSSIVELLQSKTSDAYVQRQGERQFATMGDKIATRLQPLLENEGMRFADHDFRAVTLAVTETFDKSKLSSTLLALHNLQVARLENFLYAIHPDATRDFSQDAEEFYKRIIKECCNYIVGIASQLPSFTESMFAEVLMREDVIIALVNRVLEEFQKLQARLDPAIEIERLERDYRVAVASKFDVLQLIGAEVSPASRRHRLSAAYIRLSAVVQPLFPTHLGTSPAHFQPTFVNDATPFPVDDILASSRRLLIRGLAGSGKTTLLQWIAVRAATRSFEGKLAIWNDHLPFYIRLREYAHSRLPGPDAFVEATVNTVVGDVPGKWVYNLLRSGRALVLIDGLDELPGKQREEVYLWFKELTEMYKEACFIITSRPFAAEEGWIDFDTFSDAELQPMDLQDINLFIDHWHKALAQVLHADEEKNEILSLAEHLKKQVEDNRSLRSLATNPLLCAMLCALNRERWKYLPVKRIALYRACSSLLLERRDLYSGVDLSDYPSLDESQKTLLLEELAYWMLKDGASEIEVGTVDGLFTKRLLGMPNIESHTTGQRVRRLLVERTGIIREPAVDQVEFAHRTFQEFFAAQSAVNVRDTEMLLLHALDPSWQDVIVLAAGLVHNQLECEQLVKGLIALGNKETEKDNQYKLHLLAVSCLETAVDLGPETKDEVERLLGHLVPPKNMTDARAFATAGELAVKYLVNKGERTPQANAACVRALSIIGGDAALDVLEGYAHDKRDTVVNELLKVWKAFDEEAYSKRILSHLHKINVDMERLPSENALRYFVYLTNLTNLDLTHCGQLRDLTPLAGLVNLVSLSLEGCNQLNGMSMLANLSKLVRLQVTGGSWSESLDLEGVPTLASLLLSNCNQLHTLNLGNLPHLTSLRLDSCNQLDQLSISGLPRLSSITIHDCDQFSNMRVSDVPTLTSLSLYNCGQICDLGLLVDQVNLTTLYLEKCDRLRDLAQLKSQTNLTTLFLRDCPQLRDLGVLSSLSRLKAVHLSGQHAIDRSTVPPAVNAKIMES